MYANDVAQVNDRVTRLVALLRKGGLLIDEDPLHPAVLEADTSAGVAASAREQLAYTRSGREHIAAAAHLDETIGLAEAQALLAMPALRERPKREAKRPETRKETQSRGSGSAPPAPEESSEQTAG